MIKIAACTFALLASAALGQEGSTSLNSLLLEARQHNAAIRAAESQIQVSQYGPQQASALPDTEVMLQHFTVGSPRPFAGYSNSDFAYTGFGVAQEIPYPGKRALRGKVAQQDVAISTTEKNAVVWDVITRLKLAYFELAASQQIVSLMERNQQAADQIEQAAEARYRVGQGTQQDVIRAQLEQTKLLNDVSIQRRAFAEAQSTLKALLNRPPESPDILPAAVSPRQIANPEMLFDKLQRANPELQVNAEQLSQSRTAVELAKREKKPDFGVQYMWQHTADNFRDYYVGTFSIRLPNRSRVRAAEAQAQAKITQAEAQEAARLAQMQADLGEQIAITQNTEQQLRIYDQGLIPQSEAALNAGLAGFRTGKQEYQSLLASFADTLQLSIERARIVAEHESAIARIENLIGEELR